MSNENDLNETDLELISASIDEDLSEFERRRLNSNVLAKTEGEKTWVRYNAISAVMKKQFPQQISKDFSSQVMQTIAEQGYEQEQESATQINIKRVSSHLKQVAGLAVAASVAAFSVVTYQNFYPANSPATDTQQVAKLEQETTNDMKPDEVLAIQDSQRIEFAPATVQHTTQSPQINNSLINPPLQQASPVIEENRYYQELNPYIHGHAGFGSQRVIAPYVEIIELREVQD